MNSSISRIRYGSFARIETVIPAKAGIQSPAFVGQDPYGPDIALRERIETVIPAKAGIQSPAFVGQDLYGPDIDSRRRPASVIPAKAGIHAFSEEATR